MSFRTTQDRVIIRPIDHDAVTTGGIILHAGHSHAQQEGYVVAVGPGALVNEALIATTLVEGERVLYAKQSGTKIVLNGEDLLIMKEADVYGVLLGETE